MVINNYSKIFILFLLLVFSGCLKDNVVEIPQITFSSSEEIIHFLESEGDYINSRDCPAVIDAQEVYNNRSHYLVIDIRPPHEFLSGHIQNSVNVEHKNLISLIDSLGAGNYGKIVIVSQNGQSSGYYTALLRLYGYNNVYSMIYGMATWHRDFADDWIAAIEILELKNYTNLTVTKYPKNNLSKLPSLSFSKPSLSVEEKIRERIITLLAMEFPEHEVAYIEPDLSINKFELTNRLMFNSNDYIICFGIDDSYVFQVSPGEFMGHITGSIQYNPPPFSDFNSSKDLQTLPLDRKIIIYSYDGTHSAFLTAYLKLLGYDAVSLLFGLNILYPEYANVVPILIDNSFVQKGILNYPYEK